MPSNVHIAWMPQNWESFLKFTLCLLYIHCICVFLITLRTFIKCQMSAYVPVTCPPIQHVISEASVAAQNHFTTPTRPTVTHILSKWKYFRLFSTKAKTWLQLHNTIHLHKDSKISMKHPHLCYTRAESAFMILIFFFFGFRRHFLTLQTLVTWMQGSKKSEQIYRQCIISKVRSQTPPVALGTYFWGWTSEALKPWAHIH